MRWIAQVLALYFLGLAMVPCTDTHVCSEIHATWEHDHSDDKEHDTCTPICVCVCCGASCVSPQLITYPVDIEEELPSARFVFVDRSCPGFSARIWHPPVA